eukprot:6192071-Pleurochrysis_carterae.AAC.2
MKKACCRRAWQIASGQMWCFVQACVADRLRSDVINLLDEDVTQRRKGAAKAMDLRARHRGEHQGTLL